MSDDHGQPPSKAPSSGPPQGKKPSAARKKKPRNKKTTRSAAGPSKSPPLETEGPFFSPWTWNFPAGMASSSSEETKKGIFIEEGSYFHYELHHLAKFCDILTSLKEKLLAKESEEVPAKSWVRLFTEDSEKH